MLVGALAPWNGRRCLLSLQTTGTGLRVGCPWTGDVGAGMHKIVDREFDDSIKAIPLLDMYLY